jgi:hypothetical protein
VFGFGLVRFRVEVRYKGGGGTMVSFVDTVVRDSANTFRK